MAPSTCWCIRPLPTARPSVTSGSGTRPGQHLTKPHDANSLARFAPGELTMTRHNSRRGYTLFELIVVMAILILLAAVLIPTVAVFRGDSRPRAGTDSI